MKVTLEGVYKKLYSSFGPQDWWPGETPFEVMVGAILTQNTNWQNVEKAIANLRAQKVLAAHTLYKLPHRRLASLIRPAGYFNIKAARLKEFVKFFLDFYRGNIRMMKHAALPALRQQLLAVKGIGPETADSILLYALGKPIFVVDAYTRRIFSRHRYIREDYDYHQMQDFCMQRLEQKVQLFNEFHALLVKLGKDFCLKSKPKCHICPLRGVKEA
ncbi:MAG: endonuclease III domain-containing protein [Candidatus Omnitrophica bacterium]|nr:endonuclease III domain-containing protein [Candidatus Omnitrophota bacterium]